MRSLEPLLATFAYPRRCGWVPEGRAYSRAGSRSMTARATASANRGGQHCRSGEQFRSGYL